MSWNQIQLNKVNWNTVKWIYEMFYFLQLALYAEWEVTNRWLQDTPAVPFILSGK